MTCLFPLGLGKTRLSSFPASEIGVLGAVMPVGCSRTTPPSKLGSRVPKVWPILGCCSLMAPEAPIKVLTVYLLYLLFHLPRMRMGQVQVGRNAWGGIWHEATCISFTFFFSLLFPSLVLSLLPITHPPNPIPIIII